MWLDYVKWKNDSIFYPNCMDILIISVKLIITQGLMIYGIMYLAKRDVWIHQATTSFSI